ncbi:FlxA-like family protein [Clostridium sp.]|uniref:FlxA-like family protein n=1 Tax=Clostridium sp. TaxID=1506 RepID=UPI00260A164D|nr:FlxA-like family protein [Clostridium sp.]
MRSITINSNRNNLFQNISINTANGNNKNKNTVNGNSSVTNKQDKKESALMQNLLKQKQELKEEKQALATKKMDAKEKKVKMDELNKKIKDIDAQIQQLKIQEKQEELQKQQDEISKKKAEEETSSKNTNETKEDVIISASLGELIKINGSQKTIHLLKDSKNRQKIEAEYIEPNDIPNSYDNNRLSQISASIANIDMTISKKIGDLNKSAERIQAKTELALKQIKDNKDNEIIADPNDTDNNKLAEDLKDKTDSKLATESNNNPENNSNETIV